MKPKIVQKLSLELNLSKETKVEADSDRIEVLKKELERRSEDMASLRLNSQREQDRLRRSFEVDLEKHLAKSRNEKDSLRRENQALQIQLENRFLNYYHNKYLFWVLIVKVVVVYYSKNFNIGHGIKIISLYFYKL